MVGQFLPCPACGQAIRIPFPSQQIHLQKKQEIRLVQRPRIPPPPPRKGSLAERVASLKAAQAKVNAEPATGEAQSAPGEMPEYL